ncbi:MAG: DISARM system SNF2-like helicase DrmD [Acidobacteriota bacterium]|nr:DISARM system SNF2-like helicase DrmD [Acidobacteriota bacterium]
MQQTATSTDIPRVGMLARVRNRRGIVASVEPYDSPHGDDAGRLHLVQVEYKDHDSPHSERLLWELEPGRKLLPPSQLPRVHNTSPMPAEDFDALLRAARWTALMPYLDPDGSGPLDRQPVSSPLHSGIRVEDYQLVPLLRALQMPRVNLLIADDVGLGKTVEAGLILKELLLRRRIRRVLVLVPAALRQQWRDELDTKFALPFEVVDRERTERLRRELGIDASPWRSFSRIVASYHYLRQPDIQEQFLAASQTHDGSPRLAWDLLIVDECHNLMPSPFGDDSELCQMLRQIAPCFEHRLFLSATPHNGHTRSFTGLLEILDPVRVSQTDELTDRARDRVGQLVMRRLKRDLNRASAAPRFCTRNPPKPVLLHRSRREQALSEAFHAFRKAVHSAIAASQARERAGTFAIEILGKRLLSCPTAFADSWYRARDGYARAERAERAATDADVTAAQRSVERETSDDRETEERTGTAAGVVGAWLLNVADSVAGEMAAIDHALEALGFTSDGPPTIEQTPKVDARFDALSTLIEELLLVPAGSDATPAFRDDERLVVFTEYKTTLDHLERRLRGRYDPHVLTLFGSGGAGGMDDADRNRVREAFNDPDCGVRILIATDAASEGLNLHRSARYLLHYDCPWNPSRLEQRNGRLDRYGQARDVTVHHFLSDADPDLQFLDHVIRKANEIREDLGSVNELFDVAAHRRLIEGEDLARVQFDLDHGLTREIRQVRSEGIPGLLGPAEHRGSAPTRKGADASEPDTARLLEDLATEIDFDPAALRHTLEAAMAAAGGRPQLGPAPAGGDFWRLLRPDLPGWRDTIDESVRQQSGAGIPGGVRSLAFDPDSLLRQVGGRGVFSPRPEVSLLHLAHPMIVRALRVLTQRRLPGLAETARWTVRRGGVPHGEDALILLSLEEVAVNELRETFHHWVRTITLPVRGGVLGQRERHAPARNLAASAGAPHTSTGNGSLGGPAPVPTPAEQDLARTIFLDVEGDLEAVVSRHAEDLTESLREQLQADGKEALKREDERYRSRQGEVSELIEQTRIQRLEREIERLRREQQQRLLFDQRRDLERIANSIQEMQREIAHRRRHYEEAREQLERERRRIVDRLLPKRHALAGKAQAFPVAIEVRLP